MSPRRQGVYERLVPRRTRRGKDLGGQGQGQGNKLTITSNPASSYQNRVAGTGATVRLQTVTGANVLLAGVPVTARLVVGSAAALTPATVTINTDANGIAAFPAFTLQGPAGGYTLAFTATNYVTAQANVALVAGVAVAANSTASVPGGTINAPTTIRITLKDVDNNPLGVAGTSSVTVTVTGTNPVSQTTVTPASDGSYTFLYTPTTSGTDTVAVKYGGTSISGSPYTSVVGGSTGTFVAGKSLPVGLFGGADSRLFAKGPAYSSGAYATAEPIYRLAMGAGSATSVLSELATADSKNILLVATPAGGRGAWTDVSGSCKTLNMATYISNLQNFHDNLSSTDSASITSALSRRRLIFYVIDEPWISDFCGSIWPFHVKWMCRAIKAIWPDCITVARMSAENMDGDSGWKSGLMTAAVGNPYANEVLSNGALEKNTNASNLPSNYFDKLDYTWTTYRGKFHSPSSGETPAHYLARAKITVNNLGYGAIPGINWANLGDRDECWDYNNDGVSSGRLKGDLDTGATLISEPCVPAGSGQYYVTSPRYIKDFADYCASDPDAPFATAWAMAETSLNTPPFDALQRRSDFVAAWTYWITKGNGRSTTFAWRTAK